jgi:hypothetical protein
VGQASLALLAADAGATIAHPLLDPTVAAALVALPRGARYHERTEAMLRFFGSLLPDDVLGRRTKAHFDEVFWHGHSRSLAARWNGEGVDPEVVDVDRLCELWRGDEPNPRTFTLLQSVALALDGVVGGPSAGDRLEQVLGRAG